MEAEKLEQLADYVLKAQDGRYEIKKITAVMEPDLSVEEAYEVQQELIRKKESRGEKIIGPKMGLTSHAKLEQMNVNDPIYGFVFDTMVVKDGGTIFFGDYIHPKVEPEIGFILKQELRGPGVTREDVMKATELLFPGIEIIDSRFQNFDFTLPDVIADNTSAAGAVYGAKVKDLNGLDLETIGVVLEINGEVQTIGAGAAVLDHPAESVARLANMLAEKGESVKPGQPILTGGVTAAVSVKAGDEVVVRFGDRLGSCKVSVK